MTSPTETSTMPAPSAVITPKSWTGPTLLAMSEPNPIMSVMMAAIMGQNRVWIVFVSAGSGASPFPTRRLNSTIMWTVVAIATTVTIAESIVDTMVSFCPTIASKPRVDHRARRTTASGAKSHRTL